jgi:hypothetical protein
MDLATWNVLHTYMHMHACMHTCIHMDMIILSTCTYMQILWYFHTQLQECMSYVCIMPRSISTLVWTYVYVSRWFVSACRHVLVFMHVYVSNMMCILCILYACMYTHTIVSTQICMHAYATLSLSLTHTHTGRHNGFSYTLRQTHTLTHTLIMK